MVTNLSHQQVSAHSRPEEANPCLLVSDHGGSSGPPLSCFLSFLFLGDFALEVELEKIGFSVAGELTGLGQGTSVLGTHCPSRVTILLLDLSVGEGTANMNQRMGKQECSRVHMEHRRVDWSMQPGP